MLLGHALESSEEGIFLHTRTDGRLFNLAHLRAKTKVQHVLIRESLFTDDAALTSHTQAGIQGLIDRFATACYKFGLTISLKKTNIIGQDVRNFPSINSGDHALQVMQEFTYLHHHQQPVSRCRNQQMHRQGFHRHLHTGQESVGKWCPHSEHKDSDVPSLHHSSLLYGSETWTAYASQERHLNAFHQHCLRWILGICWQDHIPNHEIQRSEHPQYVPPFVSAAPQVAWTHAPHE